MITTKLLGAARRARPASSKGVALAAVLAAGALMLGGRMFVAAGQPS